MGTNNQFIATNNSDTLEIGTNLHYIADWSTQYPFLDFWKSSRDWITHGEGRWNTKESDLLDLDAHGWLQSLPSAEDGVQYSSVGTFIANPNDGSRFVVFYEGEGEIEYLLGAKQDLEASQPGKDVFIATPGKPLHLKITSTDPHSTGDYLRNIQVIPEEYAHLNDIPLFNPDFIDTIEDYEVLRFMEWMDTNNSTVSQWEEYAQIQDLNYTNGVPVEVMVALANQTGIDPWFTMPHQATDEYITQFALTVKQYLDPELDVYIEFSNEVWNLDFDQAHWAMEQGQLAYTNPNVGKYAKWRDLYSQRTTEITRIWDDVFGSAKERVIGVMAGQAANPWIAKRSLDYHWATEALSHEDYGIDAIAIAPYFGSYLGKPSNAAEVESWTHEPDGGLELLFEELTTGGVLTNGYAGGALQQAYDNITAHAQLAQSHGLELIAYEGGQHLVGSKGVENNQAITELFIAANRDPRIGEIYRDYFTTWNELGGGLFANFKDVDTPSQWGSWGILESIYDDSSPKYNAVQDLIGGVDDSSSQSEVNFELVSNQNFLVEEITSNEVENLEDFTLKTINLQDVSGEVELKITVTGDATSENVAGFYKVDDLLGNVSGIAPGESGYTEAALAQRIENLELTTSQSQVSSYEFTLAGGQLLAPYFVANGDVSDVVTQEASEYLASSAVAYFAFSVANPDEINHIQSSFEATTNSYKFAFEDTFGGGDKDFNDLVLQMDW